MADDPKLRVIDGGLGKPLTISRKARRESSRVKTEHRGGDQIGNKLTSKQEAFVQNILKGMNQSDAYRNAGYSARLTPKQTWENASKLFALPKVSQRIMAGRKAQERSAVHSGASLRATLIRRLEKMTTEADTHANRIRAMEVLGKTEHVALFLDRSTDVPSETLTPEEVQEQLEDKLKQAFGE